MEKQLDQRRNHD